MRLVFVICALFALAACAGGQKGGLPPAQQQSIAFQAEGPTSLTLFSVINNRTGSGGHTSLMVSGSQRVLFDPAGSFRHETITEYGDVLYGMTDRRVQFYKSAHSRNSHHVVSQTIVVAPEVAEQALRLVMAQGNVSSAFCANSTSSILRQLPGFESIKVTFFPDRLMENFASLPGVETDRYYENDAGDVVDGISALQISE